MTTIGIILAAGGGSRFSGPTHKLLAPFRGAPVIRSALDGLEGAALDEMAIITGAVDLADLIPPNFTVVQNDEWRTGQASSLVRAVEVASAHGHGAMVIGLGDQPLVPPSAWRSVAGCLLTPIVTASFSGQRRPPVRLDATIWPLLPRSGDEGARVVMAKHSELVTVLECAGEPVDIDTVEDLDRLDDLG